MKRFIMLFIIIVPVMTFALTYSNPVSEEEAVSQKELDEYRNIVVASSEKVGYQLTEKELDEKVQEYKETQISTVQSQNKGMDIKQAFKTSLILSALCCGGFFIIVSLRWAQHRERFGSDSKRRFFWWSDK